MEFGRLKQVYSGPESYITPALEVLKTVDWEDKAREISKFLFDPSESDKVLWFREYASEEKIRDWLRTDNNSG
jgi:hypothetical protein